MKAVAIITRTKNRPLTLKRTLGSIASQTFKDYQWVIVNDGGNANEIDKIAQCARDQEIEVIVIHNKESRGMETSSNQGIKGSASKYIAIIDDDDTWHPEFLNKTIRFLENPHNKSFKGVVTQTLAIEERLTDKGIYQILSYPFDPDLDSISLFQVARCKSFPNLSFVYHRDALETIGLYRDDLSVLGDWEFALRFVRAFDIGFLPENLANYHFRKDINNGDSYQQSNIGAIYKNTYTKLKNELLRNDLDNKEIGLGFLINLGNELNQMERFIRRGSSIYIIKRLFSTAKFRIIYLYFKLTKW